MTPPSLEDFGCERSGITSLLKYTAPGSDGDAVAVAPATPCAPYPVKASNGTPRTFRVENVETIAHCAGLPSAASGTLISVASAPYTASEGTWKLTFFRSCPSVVNVCR